MLAVCTLLPMVAFSVVMVGQHSRQTRAAQDLGLLDTARALRIAIDREIAAIAAALRVLAASAALDRGDLREFYGQARQVQRDNDLWLNVALVGPDGQQLVNLSVPFGAPLPRIVPNVSTEQVWATRATVVSNLFVGKVLGRQVLVVEIPVIRDETLRYTLAAVVPPEQIARLLHRRDQPPEALITVVDGAGRIIARTRGGPEFVGQPVSESLGLALATGKAEHVWKGTTRDGESVYAAFSRSQLSPWAVSVALPAAPIDAAAQRSLMLVSGAGLGLLAAGTAAAAMLGHRIARQYTRERAHAEAEAAHRRRTAERFADVSRALSQSLDPMRVSQLVADAVGSLFDVQSVAIYRHDADSGDQVVVHAIQSGSTSFYWTPRLGAGEGLIGIATREGQPAWSADILEDTRLRYTADTRTRLHAVTGRAVLAVPLRTGDRIFGALALGDRVGRVFEAEEIRLAGVFAEQAAVAIENARLHAAVVRELEQRSRAEEELRQATERLRTIVAEAPLAIMTYDPEVRLTFCNPAAVAMFGWTEAEARGQRLPLVASGSAAALRAIIDRVTAGEVATTDLVIERRDGALIEAALSVAPLHDATRTVAGAVVIATDLTARRRTEEALRQTEKLSVMGSLLAGVAHELNNPLAVVLGQAHLLRERVRASAELGERVDKLTQAADRCARIVRNFLALARQRPPERGSVALGDVVVNAVELLGYLLRRDGVEVVLELASDAPPLSADADQLQQVVVNLVTNAQHAMLAVPPESRTLTLRTRFEGRAERAVLEVLDTGPGIAAGVLPRIFEPFFTTKPPSEGTGLGLSLCRTFIEAHGGAISAANLPGRGALFRVELPTGTAVTNASEPDTARPRAATLLVVDDDADTGDVIGDLLRLDGHDVTIVTSGGAGLAALEASAFDLVLTDFRMPGVDGPALYREAVRRDPRLTDRFVFMTGDALSPSTREFLEATSAPTIEKPCTAEDLRRVVHLALGRRQADGS